MFSTCYKCEANALWTPMWICGNPACGRLFCIKCGQGFLKSSCPRCGNAGTLKQPDELKRLFQSSSPTPALPEAEATFLGEKANSQSTSSSASKKKKKARQSAQEQAERGRKANSSVLDRLLEVLNKGGFESKGGWFSSPQPLVFTANSGLEGIREDEVDILLRDLQDEFDELSPDFWGYSLFDATARRMKWIKFRPYRTSVRTFAEYISSQRSSAVPQDSVHAHTPSIIPFGTCLHLAAVIAAADGQLAAAELHEVTTALLSAGLPSDQAKNRFEAICRKVQDQGVDLWADRLCDLLKTPDSADPTTGVECGEALALLKKLVILGGKDYKSRGFFNRFKAALRH